MQQAKLQEPAMVSRELVVAQHRHARGTAAAGAGLRAGAFDVRRGTPNNIKRRPRKATPAAQQQEPRSYSEKADAPRRHEGVHDDDVARCCCGAGRRGAASVMNVLH